MKSGVFTILSRIKSTLEIGKSSCIWYFHAAIIIRVHKKTVAKLLDKQGPRRGFILFENRIRFCVASLIGMSPPVPIGFVYDWEIIYTRNWTTP
jgi:hypothetical protein